MTGSATGDTRIPPSSQPRAATKRAPSLVLVNTGEGKGKTTAALGTALRAIAQGWSVGVIQFTKSGRWKVGEERIARQMGVDWWSIGEGFTRESKE
jgi:cob(I)alamin adenosyltransferase